MTDLDLRRIAIVVPSGGQPRSRMSEAFLAELDRQTGGGLIREWGVTNICLNRNTLTARAMGEKLERDLWLWLDDDEWGAVPEVWAFIRRALERWPNLEGALVGGVYAPRMRACAGAPPLVQGPDWARIKGDMGIGAAGDYYPADWLAGGAILHSRESIELMLRRVPVAYYGRLPARGGMLWRNVVTPGHDGRDRESGEEIGFCQTAREVGLEVWLDTRWVLRHQGLADMLPGDGWTPLPALESVSRPPWAPGYCPAASAAS